MNTSTIIHKLPKQLVPDQYLKKVLLACPSCFGFAGQERQDGKTKIVIEQSPKSLMLDELKELQEAFKNEHLVMFFMDAKKAGLEADVQPWTLTDGNEDDPTHHLAMFYEGNFEKFAGKDGDHTAEYCVSDAEVFPKLTQLFIKSGKDWTKFYAALKLPEFQQELSNLFKDRGVYVFMPPEGEPVSFGKNDIGGQFAWGNVSNAHGYSEQPEKKEENGGVLSFLRGKAKSSSAKLSIPEKKEEPVVAPTPVIEPPKEEPKEEPKVEFRLDKDGTTKLFKMSPPPKIVGNKKALNLWLRTFNRGQLDEETQRTRVVWVPTELIPLAQRIVGSKDEVEAMATEVHKLKKTDVKPEEPMTSERMVETTSVRREPASNYLPTMNDDEKNRALGRMAKFTQKDKQPTGLEIQKMESNWPVFHEAIGCTFEELCTRPVHELVELFDGSKIAACAFIEMRKKYLEASGLNLDSMSKKLGTKVDETKVTKTEPEEGGLSFLRGKKKTA